MRKQIKFTDKALAELKHSQFDFTYITKDGSTKSHKQIDIPFSGLRHTRLKGLKLRLFRNGGIFFQLQYWFNKKSKRHPLGEYIPGIFGKKEVEDKLYKLTGTHLDDIGQWIKDPAITERDSTRIITDTQFKNSQKKTLNEIIIACCKANLPKGKRAGTLRADSAQDLSRYMLGYNWRHKHLVFRDD